MTKRRKKTTDTNKTSPDTSNDAQLTAGQRFVAFAVDFGKMLGMTLVSVVLFSLIFQPITIWPLAFVCFVPWVFMACQLHRKKTIYFISFLGGAAFFLLNLQWLIYTAPPGYVALSGYLAVYWPLAIWAVRTGRRQGTGVIWTLPVAWVATEFLRALVMSGLPWLFVGHSFAEVLPFIQISDITGAYGVTFLAMMVNGWIIDAALARWGKAPENIKRRSNQKVNGAILIGLISINLGYGAYRLSQTDKIEEGPVLGVLQEDIELRLENLFLVTPQEIFTRYMKLAVDSANAEPKPELIVFPESMWGGFQHYEFLEQERPWESIEGDKEFRGRVHYYHVWARRYDRATSALARGDYAELKRVLNREVGTNIEGLAESGRPARLLVGVSAIELTHQEDPKKRQYNSVVFYDDDGILASKRYNKIHLVLFGERVPFRFTRLHWLYEKLNEMVDFSNGGENDFSLTPGDTIERFDLKLKDQTYRFGTPICYEDAMPYMSRRFVWENGERQCDFLVNVSNDGWFLHSSELSQHLAICTFRAIENRVGIARSVNTGISGFIDPNGRLYSIVENEDGRRVGNGLSVVGYRNAPIMIDSRRSFYGIHGDIFAIVCLILACSLWFERVIARLIGSNSKKQQDEEGDGSRAD